MRNLGLAAIALLGLLLGGGAQAQTLGEKIAAEAQIGAAVTAVGVDSFADTHKKFPGGVVGFPDVTYSALLGYRPLKLDLFLPPPSFKSKGPRPLLIYIHGGGWVMGGPRRSAAFLDWPKVLASIAEHGYVVASVSYRFAKEAPFPAQIQDVKSAIRWLRVNADKYDIDKRRVMTWGQSAGGHLAGLAAVSCGVAALNPAPRVAAPEHPVAEVQASAPVGFDQASDCVQGAVVWFGVFDFSKLPQYANGGKQDAFLDCGGAKACTPEQLALPSPVTYISDKTPPILIMHGTADTTVPIAQSEEFYERLKAKGVKTEFIKVPAVGHSFLGKSPEATRGASKMALAKTIDFINGIIGDPSTK
jgi:acetyl esterase/lipase